MTRSTVYCAGRTPALTYARQYLTESGIQVTDCPEWNTKHLLLDVPSFRPGLWTETELDTLLASLPSEIMIWGGNLQHPALEPFSKTDLLQDEVYLLENAKITADCTIPIAEAHKKAPWNETPTLIIGWGRIGKALSGILQKESCPLTIATGSLFKTAEIQQAGFRTLSQGQGLETFRLIINTAPTPVLSREDLAACRDCVKIDLASKKGLAGEDILWERSLPGRFAPERSGALIARTFLRLSQEVKP